MTLTSQASWCSHDLMSPHNLTPQRPSLLPLHRRGNRSERLGSRVRAGPRDRPPSPWEVLNLASWGAAFCSILLFSNISAMTVINFRLKKRVLLLLLLHVCVFKESHWK